MKTIFYNIMLLLGCFAFFVSCANDDDNEPPRDFEIVQVKEFHDKIHLRWTESRDPENSIVTYDIYIKEDIAGTNYRLVKGGLTDLNFGRNGGYIRPNGSLYGIDQPDPQYVYSYPILNLEDDKNWSVKITATDQEGNSKDIITTLTTLFFPPLPNFVGEWRGTYDGFYTDRFENRIESTGSLAIIINRRNDFESYDLNYFVGQFTEPASGFFDPLTGSIRFQGIEFLLFGSNLLDECVGQFPEEGNTIEGVMMYNGEVTGSWSATKQ